MLSQPSGLKNPLRSARRHFTANVTARVKMHEQALEFLRAHNKPKEAALVEAQLDRLRRGKG